MASRKYTFSVYTLRDEEGSVRYVGLTSNPPLIRLQGHRSGKGPTGDWIRSEIDAGRTVTIVVEEEYKSENAYSCWEASQAEKRFITGYRRLLGEKLLNREGPRNKRLVAVKAGAYCA